ncbi:hypothetical protein PRIPAC_82403 [Pristionchus pacificus]|uniref:G protein-coupled receptor n=1 Tax=Pristionchus pacificus TaxID=54126 RepID=A0A2A6CBU7_PRIPA|nr:hypothetical protein PRIPAC_82403 [Pristionchus pacificus]|eukprot:PDM75586.1 G protein-coupled receptor [Pristionchus pacificus]
MSFTVKLFLRMVHTITLRTSVTTVKTLSHDSLIYALALETVLPLASFGLPAIGLTLGLIFSHSDPEWNAICFLFHSSHALFVSIITIIFYLRYRQTPNQYISTKVPSSHLPSFISSLQISHLSDDPGLPSLLSVPHNDNFLSP